MRGSSQVALMSVVLAPTLALTGVRRDTSLRAQETGRELLRELRGAPDGPVRLVFETDDGVVVCDDGSVMTGTSEPRWGRTRGGRRCGEGEAEVTFSVRGGSVVGISPPRPSSPSFAGTDLGQASGPAAGGLFAALAAEGAEPVAERALVPAILARDAVVWPALLRLARDRERSPDLRRKAVFWLGQEAAESVTVELTALAGDPSEEDRIHDAAVFALSQRPSGEGVPALMELARGSDDARVRRRAIFWLAQSTDPRVLPFFEEILLGGGS